MLVTRSFCKALSPSNGILWFEDDNKTKIAFIKDRDDSNSPAVMGGLFLASSDCIKAQATFVAAYQSLADNVRRFTTLLS